MEVEVKLKLPDAAAHQKVANVLASFRVATHLQENVFFDGSNGELSAKRAVLRLRFYDGDSRCVVSVKGKAVIVDGVSRVTEVEEDVEAPLARACVAEPWRLAVLDCPLLKSTMADYGCEDFVCLGGFRNVRGVFEWQGLKIELDETHYDFGTSYEIECETEDPEGVKKLLEDFLRANGVPFSHSKISKFAVFRSGKLPDQ
uniref:TSA: Wollemia nobilis Ref_Wollemi_Transcript_8012_1293 transcribed RNA sequence n=1 Tax=Wollemia nobilis TaxID=56998 RepID=A0A0C9RWR6_9CONI